MIRVDWASDTKEHDDVIREMILDASARVRVSADSTSSTVVYFSGSFALDSGSAIREAKPRRNADLEWFYSDPGRVAMYAGQFVSLRNRQVMGSGSESDAYNASPGSLVIYVETPEEAATATLGL